MSWGPRYMKYKSVGQLDDKQGDTHTSLLSVLSIGVLYLQCDTSKPDSNRALLGIATGTIDETALMEAL